MKKLTLINFSQEAFWKMPDTFISMVKHHFKDWDVRILESLEKDLHLLKDADAIIGLPFPANLIRGNSNLTWVHFLTNQVPLSWQKLEDKYTITNSKVSVHSVAEHALYLMMKGLRQEVFYHEKGWSPENFRIPKLASHSKLGIIGFGNIGKRFFQLATPLFNEIRFLTNRDYSPNGSKKFSYEEARDFFHDLDVVVIATELNPRTQNFFQDPSIYQYLKKDVIIVNVARGELLVEKDLVSFLTSHPQALYLTDVVSPEPYPENGELLKLKNVYISPHVGARFDGIWHRIEMECLHVIKDRNV